VRDPAATGRLVARGALRGMGRAVVRARRQQLHEQQRDDDLARELGMWARSQLGAQEQLQPTVSHCAQPLMSARPDL
jgi:hypothetical protein